ncbi:MAG: AAA family ATPase [Nitrososphaerales archaeon]
MVTPAPYLPIDALGIITNTLFQGGLTKERTLDLGKKVILSLLIKYGYDNLQKLVSALFNPKYLRVFVIKLLYLVRVKRLRFTNEPDLVSTESQKMDVIVVNNLLELDVKKQTGMFLKRLLGHTVLVHLTETTLDFWHLAKSFPETFLNTCRLPTVSKAIKTDYKLLISKGTKDCTYGWETPERVTTLLDEVKDRSFFRLIETFVRNADLLEDIATQAYLINGPPGVGKTTVVDILYHKNIFNTILRINMMGFIDSNYSLGEILDKIVVPYPVRSTNYTLLLVLDEVDKFFAAWIKAKLKDYIESQRRPVSKEQLKEQMAMLKGQFYTTLQRLIDGDILVRVPRLVLMFFTNHGETLWTDLPPQYESVQSRFVPLDFDYCRRDEVISYLRTMYTKLIRKNEERGLTLKVNEDLYDQIDRDLLISYRELKALIALSNYELEELVQRLKGFRMKQKIHERQELDLDSLSQSSYEMADNTENSDKGHELKMEKVQLPVEPVEKPTPVKVEERVEKKIDAKIELKLLPVLDQVNDVTSDELACQLHVTRIEEGPYPVSTLRFADDFGGKPVKLFYSSDRLVMVEKWSKDGILTHRGLVNEKGDGYLKIYKWLNGSPQSIENFNEDYKAHGRQQYWDAQGRPARDCRFLNGMINGVEQRWNDGVRSKITTYVDGSREGIHLQFGTDGKISFRRLYKNNKLTETSFFDENGLEIERVIVNSDYVGVYRWLTKGVCTTKEGEPADLQQIEFTEEMVNELVGNSGV